MKPQLRRLMKQAEENTNIARKQGREDYETTRIGKPLDHAQKHINENKRNAERQIVGVSKGITRNMENYESLRVDCWLTDVVKDNETIDQAFERVGAIIDEQLELQINSVLDE